MIIMNSIVKYFIYLSFSSFLQLPLIICTDPIDICKKCTWVGWQAWENCRYEGARRRVRMMCCPDDIPYPPTLEDCYTRCYNDTKGLVKLNDLYDFKACSFTSSNDNNQFRSTKSSSNIFKNNLPLIAGLITGSIVLLASNILLLGCLCKQKKKKERAFPARRPAPWT